MGKYSFKQHLTSAKMRWPAEVSEG